MLRRFTNRYVYYGIPPGSEQMFYNNYPYDDQIINEITYKILTRIELFKPESEIEIAPVTRMRLNI